MNTHQIIQQIQLAKSTKKLIKLLQQQALFDFANEQLAIQYDYQLNDQIRLSNVKRDLLTIL